MDLDRNIPKATRSLTTLGHMRVLGIRRFQARCLNPQCLHEVRSLISNDLPDGMTLASMGARMICKRCNKFGADVWPDWKGPSRRNTTLKSELGHRHPLPGAPPVRLHDMTDQSTRK
jgi:hypothetical protein